MTNRIQSTAIIVGGIIISDRILAHISYLRLRTRLAEQNANFYRTLWQHTK